MAVLNSTVHGALEKSGMLSLLVLNSTEIKPLYILLVNIFLSPKLLRSSLGYLMMITKRKLRVILLKMEYPGALQGSTS